MSYVFGPVPSRRLGQSLGIDPVPLKTCNWNCVYCQLGRTRPLTNERKEYIPRQEILNELHTALEAHPPGDIDWVTLVGSGEPTLHSGLGWLLRQVKNLTNLPVAVITNGALLPLPEVRQELSVADAVLPSLDAGCARLYRKINRPWPKLTFETYIQGLAAFRREYTGQIWIEVMLVKDLNDSDEALQDIASLLRKIQPDQVHLLLPLRPPAESWVQPVDEYRVRQAQAILGQTTLVFQPPAVSSSSQPSDDLEAVILGIITRHPMTEEELCTVLSHWPSGEIHPALLKLHTSHRARQVIRHGKYFWTAAGTHYAH